MSTGGRLAKFAIHLNSTRELPQELGFKSYEDALRAFLSTENYGKKHYLAEEAKYIFETQEVYPNAPKLSPLLKKAYNKLCNEYGLTKHSL